MEQTIEFDEVDSAELDGHRISSILFAAVSVRRGRAARTFLSNGRISPASSWPGSGPASPRTTPAKETFDLSRGAVAGQTSPPEPSAVQLVQLFAALWVNLFEHLTSLLHELTEDMAAAASILIPA
jgi:hypothetical protein